MLKNTTLCFYLLFIFTAIGCKKSAQEVPKEVNEEPDMVSIQKNDLPVKLDYDTVAWKEITTESGIQLDIRYATENNFTNKQIYGCGRCFLRPALTNKLIQLQKDVSKRYGLGLKLFDCYRPRPAQQKLWDIVPDARYVTPPAKGSMHNRGLAVDITLVDKDGKELDMGTEYDFFGPKAYTTNTSLPADILKNRKILTAMMEAHGLKGIRTEWWHFSLKTMKAELSDWEWNCD